PPKEKIPFPPAEGDGPLQVRKTGPVEAGLHGTISCRIEVRNIGKEPLRDVAVENTLPEGLFLLKSKEDRSDLLAPQGTNPLIWKLGTLNPGQVRTIELDLSSDKALGKLT